MGLERIYAAVSNSNSIYKTPLFVEILSKLKEITGKAPIFLLDDVFGELDAFRTTKISEYLREVGQAFITITDFANMSFLKRNEDDLLINVYKGTTAYA